MKPIDLSWYYNYVFQTVKKWNKIDKKSVMIKFVSWDLVMYLCTTCAIYVLAEYQGEKVLKVTDFWNIISPVIGK